MYHYVRPEDVTLPNFKYLHIDDFKQQLDYFERAYGFITRDDFFTSLQTGMPVPGVVLTFDDGLKDHYDFVLPELQRRNLWGLFYVCTGVYETGKLLDVHRIHMLLGRYSSKEVYGALNAIITDKMLVDSTREDFIKMAYAPQVNDNYTVQVKKILNYFIGYDHKEAVLNELMKRYFGDETALTGEFYMTREELVNMHNAGMVIGSHTVSHPVLSKLGSEGQTREIEASFNWLYNLIPGLPLKTFCYPYGGFFSFNEATEAILNANNVECSFNLESRDIDENDLLKRKTAFPRYDCNEFPHGKVRIVAGKHSE